MALSSNNAAIGWKPQSIMGTAATGAFYWHKVTNSSFSIVEATRPLPPELGGTLLPDGLFKGAAWTRGRIDMVPRLQSHFGWLLWSLAGSGSVSGSSPYMHGFPGCTDNLVPDNWLTFKRLIPKSDGNYFGETFADCKVTGLTLQAVPGQQLTASVEVRGRTVVATDPASGTGWAPTTDSSGYEAYSGIPIATISGFEMPDGVALTNINRATLTIDNGPADDASMLVLGSYHPHTVLPLSRNIRIEATAFWNNADQYKNLYFNGGTAWSPILYTSYSPFDMWFQTPGNLASVAYPGTLGFYAATGAITWTITPIDLRGGDVLMLNLVGVVNAINTESWRLYLNNSKSTIYAP